MREVPHADDLLSLRNLILGRCLNTALALPKLAQPIVSLASSVAGQSIIDNLSHEFPLDTALAAAHLFCACSDASLLRKHNRLAVLAATTLRESGGGALPEECLATSALLMLLQHLQSLPSLEAAYRSSVVRPPLTCASQRAKALSV